LNDNFKNNQNYINSELIKYKYWYDNIYTWYDYLFKFILYVPLRDLWKNNLKT
jgi:hypothetical protein